MCIQAIMMTNLFKIWKTLLVIVDVSIQSLFKIYSILFVFLFLLCIDNQNSEDDSLDW